MPRLCSVGEVIVSLAPTLSGSESKLFRCAALRLPAASVVGVGFRSISGPGIQFQHRGHLGRSSFRRPAHLVPGSGSERGRCCRSLRVPSVPTVLDSTPAPPVEIAPAPRPAHPPPRLVPGTRSCRFSPGAPYLHRAAYPRSARRWPPRLRRHASPGCGAPLHRGGVARFRRRAAPTAFIYRATPDRRDSAHRQRRGAGRADRAVIPMCRRATPRWPARTDPGRPAARNKSARMLAKDSSATSATPPIISTCANGWCSQLAGSAADTIPAAPPVRSRWT